MHWGMTAWLQLLLVVAILGALHVPLGNYMARVTPAKNIGALKGSSTGRLG
jgi:hypothetical protein